MEEKTSVHNHLCRTTGTQKRKESIMFGALIGSIGGGLVNGLMDNIMGGNKGGGGLLGGLMGGQGGGLLGGLGDIAGKLLDPLGLFRGDQEQSAVSDDVKDLLANIQEMLQQLMEKFGAQEDAKGSPANQNSQTSNIPSDFYKRFPQLKPNQPSTIQNGGTGNDTIQVTGHVDHQVNAGKGDDVINVDMREWADLPFALKVPNDNPLVANTAVINGGEGHDTVRLAGTASDYKVVDNDGQYRTLEDASGNIIRISNDVESVEFAY
jgi:hypothetical protein